MIDRHIEFLLRKHDCVVIPGWGALLCRYVPARYAADGHTMLPPGRELAFNALLSDSDGLLVASVARKEGIPFEAAAAMVQTEVEQMAVTLREEGELQLGRMGRFTATESGDTVFEPAYLAGVNGNYYGLRPMTLPLIEGVQPEVAADATGAADAVASNAELCEGVAALPRAGRNEAGRTRRRGRFAGFRAYASGAVAAIAVIVTLVLFVVSPIKLDRHTDMASLAPIPSANPAPAQAEPAAAVEEHLLAEAETETEEVATFPTEQPQAVAEKDKDAVKETAKAAQAADVKLAETEEAKPAQSTETKAVAEEKKAAKPAKSAPAPKLRFNDNDPYLVVVASFPTADQAREYITVKGKNRQLEMEQMEGKYRVYASTASNYASAGSIKESLGDKGVWVCHR